MSEERREIIIESLGNLNDKEVIFNVGEKKVTVNITLEKSKSFPKKIYSKSDFAKYIKDNINFETEDIDKNQTYNLKGKGITGAELGLKDKILKGNSNKQIEEIFKQYIEKFGEEKCKDFMIVLLGEIEDSKKKIKKEDKEAIKKAIYNKFEETKYLCAQEISRTRTAISLAKVAASSKNKDQITPSSSASSLNSIEKRLEHNEDRLQSVEMTTTINSFTPPTKQKEMI